MIVSIEVVVANAGWLSNVIEAELDEVEDGECRWVTRRRVAAIRSRSPDPRPFPDLGEDEVIDVEADTSSDLEEIASANGTVPANPPAWSAQLTVKVNWSLENARSVSSVRCCTVPRWVSR
jgi:hypothetical protein